MRRSLALLIALGLAGCAGAAGMARVDHPIAPPAPDRATVVFLRPSHQGKIDTPLYDVTDNRLDFLGTLARTTKMGVAVAPGKHLFMVYCDRHHGKRAGFLSADLAAGKVYYVLLHPRFGDLFGLQPLRQADIAGAEFSQWLGETQTLETGPEAVAWAEENRAIVEQTRDAYQAKFFDTEHPTDHTLFPFDGRDPGAPVGPAAVAAAQPEPKDPSAPPAAPIPPASPAPAPRPIPPASAAPPSAGPIPPALPPATSSAPAPAAPWTPAAGAAARLRLGAEVHARPTADAGAPPRAARSRVLLKATLKNAAGTWWFVTMPGDSGWVLEKDLEAP